MAANPTQAIARRFALVAQGHGSRVSPQARMGILRQATKLIREIAEPNDLIAMHRESMLELVTIRSLISMNVFRHLPDESSISSRDLSANIGAEESLVSRLLRMAVAAQLIKQLPDKTFAHTKFSKSYAADLGNGVAFKVLYDESFMPLSRLHIWLKEKGFKEPNRQETSPALWFDGNEGQLFFEVMQQDPERLSDFQKCMRVIGDYSPPTSQFYDFGVLMDESERMVVVDIGGGQGQTLVDVLHRYPQIPSNRVVLQELSKVSAAARKSRLLPADTPIMDYDYNLPQPIQGAKAYLMRRILHSWSDEFCIDILKNNIVPAMAPDSVLLISDYIVPDPVTPEDIGPVSSALAMMTMAGKERTLEDFQKMLDAAGLKMTGVFKPVDEHFGVVEARLKDLGMYSTPSATVGLRVKL